MWDRIRQFTTRMSKERATKRAVRKFFDGFLKGTQCKIIIRGSKGDLLGCRWYFCHLQEGHPGPHKDPYDRDFRSDLHIRHIRHGQMPCEFIKKVDPPRRDEPGYLRCHLIEGHFGSHRDRWGGSFQSSTIDTDVFTYPGRWPIRTEPFPGGPPRPLQ